MIVVDTSIWIDHLHRADDHLAALLADDLVLVSAWVRGELAMGTLRDRGTVLGLLDALPRPVTATPAEAASLVDRRALHGRGLSLVDALLLADTLLTPGALLWSRDRRLADAAAELGVALVVP